MKRLVTINWPMKMLVLWQIPPHLPRELHVCTSWISIPLHSPPLCIMLHYSGHFICAFSDILPKTACTRHYEIIHNNIRELHLKPNIVKINLVIFYTPLTFIRNKTKIYMPFNFVSDISYTMIVFKCSFLYFYVYIARLFVYLR